jgi:hypothetical protein
MGASLACVALVAAAIPAAAIAAGGEAPASGQRVFRWPAARPTDHPDPARHAYTVPEAPRSPACDAHFCVHWVAEGLDSPSLIDSNGDGVPDYVESVLSVAEHVYAIENETLGWRRPIPDGSEGGGVNKVDVYLKNLDHRLFGYSAPDRGQAVKGRGLPGRLHGYLVLDNDYGPFEYPHTKPLNDVKVTFAHEYNHLLQMAYNVYEDGWFAESTAVWMEDQVYNGIDDYLRYVRRWVKLFNTPLTANSIREYGSAVWNDWLTHRYGREIIRDVWARSAHTKPDGFSVAAYESAIRAAGGASFGEEFARFARDTAEWHTATVFREGSLYPDVPRQASLPRDGRPVRRFLNHTTFQLLAVHPDHGHAVVASAVAPPGTAAGLAIVGRIGSERQGRVVSRLSYSEQGGAMSVRLPNPGRFQRVTVVLVNADTQADGFSARRFDWNYLTDMAPFRVRARVVG